jgi:hypothetical protein
MNDERRMGGAALLVILALAPGRPASQARQAPPPEY